MSSYSGHRVSFEMQIYGYSRAHGAIGSTGCRARSALVIFKIVSVATGLGMERSGDARIRGDRC